MGLPNSSLCCRYTLPYRYELAILQGAIKCNCFRPTQIKLDLQREGRVAWQADASSIAKKGRQFPLNLVLQLLCNFWVQSTEESTLKLDLQHLSMSSFGKLRKYGAQYSMRKSQMSQEELQRNSEPVQYPQKWLCQS